MTLNCEGKRLQQNWLNAQLLLHFREFRDGKWHPAAKVELVAVPDIPGFRIERGEYSMAVEVGVLPSNKLFYRDREQDKYLTMDEFTRRILDRVLFPKLRD